MRHLLTKRSKTSYGPGLVSKGGGAFLEVIEQHDAQCRLGGGLSVILHVTELRQTVVRDALDLTSNLK